VKWTARICRPLSFVALALTGCTAAPPLRVYTLSESPASSEEPMTIADASPPPGAAVIEIARVSLPDYVDSRDLVVRQGELLERSSTGRWASRLSLATTGPLTARLAMRRPDAWVTDQPQVRTPDYRLLLHISRLDITNTGTGSVEAVWEIVPRATCEAVIRRRIQFTMSAAVGTDERVARFERSLLERLASEIDISSLHQAPSKCPISEPASDAR
jgi:uncharacterized lipoprotein YmbA